MKSMILDHVSVGRDLNLYIKKIDDIDGLLRINEYFLSHGSVKKIYTDLIECFIEAEGYFSKKIEHVVEEVDKFLLNECKEKNRVNIIYSLDGIHEAIADIGEQYKNNNKKLAYVSYIQGCLLQIRFNYVQAYSFFEEACYLGRETRYYCATGELAIKLSKYYEAEEYFRLAVDILKRDRANCIEYVETLNNLGGALDQQYKFDEAVFYYYTAVSILEKQTDSRESNLYLGLIYNNIGGSLLALENFEDAEKYLWLSLSIRERKSATINEIAITKNNLAEVFRLQKNLIKAERLLQQAMDSLKKTYKKYPNHPTIALTLNNLGNLCLDLKKYRDAKIYFEETLRILKYIFKSVGNRESTITLYNLAITCWYSRKYKEALNYFQKSMLESKECIEENDPVFKEINKDYNEFINQKKFKISFVRSLFLGR